jgi:L-serine dehydratase
MTEFISALDLFTIGIGPSSSHTVGPMRAAKAFNDELQGSGLRQSVAKVNVTLYGSLAATGPGHGTTHAIIAGLANQTPEQCDPEFVRAATPSILDFKLDEFELQSRARLPKHSNAMRFIAQDGAGNTICERVYYSVGGGFVEDEQGPLGGERADVDIPHNYMNAVELIATAENLGITIAELAWRNEISARNETEVDGRLTAIWSAMRSSIQAGLNTDGILPGYLKVDRRASKIARGLWDRAAESESAAGDQSMEWLQAYAIAVNEENAAGNRVVTAPTNGAAGIIPAVGYYAREFKGVSDEALARDYLLTAAAIGSLYKRNASISGAEAGCQGEVGSACSMAAGALTAVLGGTPAQVENAAEIAMEHNLGLTCDPVGGFVQMPCIERNAIAAGTAVAASRLALIGDGSHKISLDTVIETMRQTGLDMSSKYKETSMGGLAVNVVEC